MAKLVDVGPIGPYFESLGDPRHTRDRKRLMVDIAVIAVRGVIRGRDGPTAIPRSAKHRASWLARHRASPNGVPSRDRIRRPLGALEPEALQRRFRARIADAIPTDPDDPGRLVAIDGKTCRGSRDGAQGLGAAHIVGARAGERGIAPGPVATDAKSNEITAIPRLPGRIDRAGTLSAIDAMGRPKDIVEPIVTGGGDRVIAVEDDQPKRRAAVEAFFLAHLGRGLEDLQYRCHETREDGRGRIDERSYYLAKMPRDFASREGWPWVKAIGSTARVTRHADGTGSDAARPHLSGGDLSGERFGGAVRGHWGIESTRWVRDVNSREDESRARERTWGNDLSWPRRFAVTLLKRHPAKDGLRGKMISRGLNTDFLTQVLSLQRV